MENAFCIIYFSSGKNFEYYSEWWNYLQMLKSKNFQKRYAGTKSIFGFFKEKSQSKGWKMLSVWQTYQMWSILSTTLSYEIAYSC